MSFKVKHLVNGIRCAFGTGIPRKGATLTRI